MSIYCKKNIKSEIPSLLISLSFKFTHMGELGKNLAAESISEKGINRKLLHGFTRVWTFHCVNYHKAVVFFYEI